MKTLIATLGAVIALTASTAAAADSIYFPAVDNVSALLVQKINAETQRIDMSCWYLSDDNVASALLSRFQQGVQVRLIGDRGSIFEIDKPTRFEFYRLAAAGVPVRLRYNPTWYPEIDHWKATIFAGQNLVAFGSANYTPYELAPFSSTNYDDETVLFTTDSSLVGAFKTKFDQLWNDTTFEPESVNGGPPYFKNWADACATESTCDWKTQYPNPAPMVINTARLEPNNPMPADLIWGQGPDFNNRLIQEINAETNHVDFVIYRLTVDNLTNAVLNKFNAHVPMRLIVEPQEYLNRVWPEFWITHANEDKLWAAGVPMKMRIHDGLTHMKTLITSAYATNASSNYTAGWQRDNDYFVSASTKPTIYSAIQNRFNVMWNDPSGFADFVPQGPDGPNLASPASGQTAVSTTPTLTWNIATFAANYDVYLGTSPNSMAVVGNVLAQMVNNPPATYSWTPSAALQGGTTYYWKIVSRTNATPRNPNLVAPSTIWSFTTAGSSSTPPGAPGSPAPSSGATSVSTSPTLTWTASGATSYDVKFGTSNPPPQVTTSQAAASYTPNALATSTTYFWQIVAKNSGGSTTGPVWSFTTAASGGGGGALPSPWQTQDVGSTGQTGSASYASGTFTVKGAGADVWDTTDAFRYVYQAVNGDFTIVARAASLQNTHQWAKAGLMLRASNTANSAHVMIDVTPGGTIEFMTRQSTGAAAQIISYGSQTPPAWLRLRRSGNTVSADVSSNGSAWTALGSTTVSFSASANLGLIVCSHVTTTLNTAVFDNVSVTTTGAPPPPPPPTASNIVIYGGDVSAAALHGTWALASDPSSPNGTKLVTTDAGVINANAPLASPSQYFDVSFTAQANTPYTIWLRLQALANSKFNDAVWVQFSDALANGSAVYPINTTQGLLVNLATDSGAASLNKWGWQNGAYWLSQATTVTFPTTGTHTLRIQIREDGVELDQIVLSPTTYLNSAPGPVTNDSTIVPKP